MRRRLAWLGVLLLAGLSARWAPRAAPSTAPLRLLGPLAELAAEIEWVRFQAALRRGQSARALELAEHALTLDPRSAAGWERLAAWLVFDLASAEREPSLARRRAAFAAGLSVLARARESVEEPGEIELFRGVVLQSKALGAPELVAGGASELRASACAAFERAAALGVAGAAALAAQLRAEDP